MDVKNFLKECSLDEAIPIFEMHKITMDQLPEMNKEDFKEVLPALGDRLKLRKGLQRGRGVISRPITHRRKKSVGDLTSLKTVIKNDPKKKAFIVQMLTNKRRVADLYQMATKVLIDFSLFSFDDGCHPTFPAWKLIDFDTGKLNCLLCKEKIQLQTRNDCATLWNVGNYKRHYANEHRNCLGTEECSSFLEVILSVENENHEMQEDHASVPTDVFDNDDPRNGTKRETTLAEEDHAMDPSNGVKDGKDPFNNKTVCTVQSDGKNGENTMTIERNSPALMAVYPVDTKTRTISNVTAMFSATEQVKQPSDTVLMSFQRNVSALDADPTDNVLGSKNTPIDISLSDNTGDNAAQMVKSPIWLRKSEKTVTDSMDVCDNDGCLSATITKQFKVFTHPILPSSSEAVLVQPNAHPYDTVASLKNVVMEIEANCERTAFLSKGEGSAALDQIDLVQPSASAPTDMFDNDNRTKRETTLAEEDHAMDASNGVEDGKDPFNNKTLCTVQRDGKNGENTMTIERNSPALMAVYPVDTKTRTISNVTAMFSATEPFVLHKGNFTFDVAEENVEKSGQEIELVKQPSDTVLMSFQRNVSALDADPTDNVLGSKNTPIDISLSDNTGDNATQMMKSPIWLRKSEKTVTDSMDVCDNDGCLSATITKQFKVLTHPILPSSSEAVLVQPNAHPYDTVASLKNVVMEIEANCERTAFLSKGEGSAALDQIDLVQPSASAPTDMFDNDNRTKRETTLAEEDHAMDAINGVEDGKDPFNNKTLCTVQSDGKNGENTMTIERNSPALMAVYPVDTKTRTISNVTAMFSATEPFVLHKGNFTFDVAEENVEKSGQEIELVKQPSDTVLMSFQRNVSALDADPTDNVLGSKNTPIDISLSDNTGDNAAQMMKSPIWLRKSEKTVTDSMDVCDNDGCLSATITRQFKVLTHPILPSSSEAVLVQPNAHPYDTVASLKNVVMEIEANCERTAFLSKGEGSAALDQIDLVQPSASAPTDMFDNDNRTKRETTLAEEDHAMDAINGVEDGKDPFNNKTLCTVQSDGKNGENIMTIERNSPALMAVYPVDTKTRTISNVTAMFSATEPFVLHKGNFTFDVAEENVEKSGQEIELVKQPSDTVLMSFQRNVSALDADPTDNVLGSKNTPIDISLSDNTGDNAAQMMKSPIWLRKSEKTVTDSMDVCDNDGCLSATITKQFKVLTHPILPSSSEAVLVQPNAHPYDTVASLKNVVMEIEANCERTAFLSKGEGSAALDQIDLVQPSASAPTDMFDNDNRTKRETTLAEEDHAMDASNGVEDGKDPFNNKTLCTVQSDGKNGENTMTIERNSPALMAVYPVDTKTRTISNVTAMFSATEPFVLHKGNFTFDVAEENVEKSGQEIELVKQPSDTVLMSFQRNVSALDADPTDNVLGSKNTPIDISLSDNTGDNAAQMMKSPIWLRKSEKTVTDSMDVCDNDGCLSATITKQFKVFTHPILPSSSEAVLVQPNAHPYDIVASLKNVGMEIEENSERTAFLSNGEGSVAVDQIDLVQVQPSASAPTNGEVNLAATSGGDNIPDWKKDGTRFGWVKYSEREAWKPAFLYPDGLAQFISKSGQLSDVKRPIKEYQQNIRETCKRTFQKGLNRFNKRNKCNFK